MRYIESNIFGDKCLECSLAAKDLHGQAQQQEGMGTSQHQERVDQSIRFDQSSIQIDTEGLELRSSGFRSETGFAATVTSYANGKEPAIVILFHHS